MDIKTEKKVYTEYISEDVKNKLEARVKHFRDAQRWRKSDRTAFMGHLITWQFVDAGYSLDVASRDYEVKRDAMIYAVTHYKFDHINCIASGFRNTFILNDALCGEGNTNTEKVTEDKYTESVHSDGDDGVMTAIFEGFIKPEEFPLLKENYNKAVWEKALFRRYPAARNYTPEQFAKAAATMCDFLEAKTQLESELRYAYGDPMESNYYYFSSVFEDLFNTLTGIKGISIAMRRNGAELEDLCNTVDKQRFDAFVAAADAMPDGETTEAYDYVSALLSATVTTPKQFEKFLWPGQKMFLDYTRDHGKLAYYWSEGTVESYAELFNDYPKGVLTLMIENDDPYEIRRKYPNICLQGGLYNSTLGSGTAQENVDDAKRAIDILGRDGGLVLASNKMITYLRDLKRENLIAIGDFLDTYNG